MVQAHPVFPHIRRYFSFCHYDNVAPHFEQNLSDFWTGFPQRGQNPAADSFRSRFRKAISSSISSLP
jgi:hypothetical protein